MAQQYCRGDFVSWDPKITTFPGLYYLGVLYAWLSSLLLSWAGATLVSVSTGRAVATDLLQTLSAVWLYTCSLTTIEALTASCHTYPEALGMGTHTQMFANLQQGVS
jgi:alpha-1,2-glucosyltransferase